ERIAGDRPPGVGGSFAVRVAAGRQRTADPRRGNGLPQSSRGVRIGPARGNHRPSLFDSFDDPAVEASQPSGEEHSATSADSLPRTLGGAKSAPSGSPIEIASGEKAKARDIIATIRTLKRIEEERRPADPEEK